MINTVLKLFPLQFIFYNTQHIEISLKYKL